jgi:hypothetical protein
VGGRGAVSSGERLVDELRREPLELGLDLLLDELGELGPVLLERAGDGLGESTVEYLSGHGSECTTAARRHPAGRVSANVSAPPSNRLTVARVRTADSAQPCGFLVPARAGSRSQNAWGTRGPRFKSGRPDREKAPLGGPFP